MEFGWIRICMDPGEFGQNGQNLVGVQVKIGCVLTDMIFLPNSDHSYHSAWIWTDGICGGG